MKRQQREIKYYLNGVRVDPPKPRREHGEAWKLCPPTPKDNGHRMAVRWAKWRAEQLGLEWPTLTARDDAIVVDFEFHRDPDRNYAKPYCAVTRISRPVWGGREREELLRFPIPPWALPCTRIDLWHATHQAGGSWADVCADGQGDGPLGHAEHDARQAKRQAARAAQWGNRLGSASSASPSSVSSISSVSREKQGNAEADRERS